MMKVLRNSRLIVLLWIFITLYPMIATALHFTFVEHEAHHDITQNIVTFDNIAKHCPYADFDFYWALLSDYKYTAKRFDFLLNIENEVIVFIYRKDVPRYFQLRAPPAQFI